MINAVAAAPNPPPGASGPSFAARQKARVIAASIRLAAFLRARTGLILGLWALFALIGGLLRLSLLAVSSPQAIVPGSFTTYMTPYLGIALAPVVGWFLATRAYPHGGRTPQPEVRLSRLGDWQQLPPAEARRRQDYGLAGFLVSLSAGLLLSMVLRLGEFLLAIPLIPPGAPDWATNLYRLMALDVTILAFMYFVSFTMALRGAPLFPRMLLLTWLYDIMAQTMIARQVGASPDLPALVAEPLKQLLDENIQKVLISMAIWIPYLVLSRRVNLTFRHRVPTGSKPS